MGQILLGIQGWNYDSRVGSFFPKATRQADYLRICARAFRTVEVDSTLYATPLALAETPTADFAYVRWMGPDRKTGENWRTKSNSSRLSP
jgi:uncharacterized protein YecE (DUF72 family)